MSKDNIDVGLFFKKAFKLVIDHPSYFLFYILPMIVFIFAFIHIYLMIDFDLFSISQYIENQDSIDVFMNLIKEKIPILIGVGILYALIGGIVSIIVSAGIVKKAEFQERGKIIDFSESLSFGLKIFPRLFATMILYILILVLPMVGIFSLMIVGIFSEIMELICISTLLLLIIIIPLIYIALRLSLIMYACIIDNLGPMDSLRRSWTVTKGNLITIFVTDLLLAVIYIVITLPFNIIGTVSSYSIISTIGSLIGVIVFGPIQLIVFTLLYLEITKRKKNTNTSNVAATDTPVNPSSYYSQ